MPKAKRRLSKFNFNVPGSHVALVGKAANGTEILVTKSLELVNKRTFTSDERKKLAASGAAMPDGSYPIQNEADLKNAIQAFGRASNKSAVAKHIKSRAKSLGLTKLLPTEGKLADMISKAYSDRVTYDPKSGQERSLEESGLRVNMSLEDILMFFTHLCPGDIETLTTAITKAANGKELADALEQSSTEPVDVFKARNSALLSKLDEEDNFQAIKEMAKSLIEREANNLEHEMPETKKNAEGDAIKNSDGAAVPEEVKKALDAKEAENVALKKRLDTLEQAENVRIEKAFIEKAKSLETLGLPEAPEGKDSVELFAKNMRVLSDANPEAYAVVEAVLARAAETIQKSSNLEAKGEDGQPGSNSDNAALEAAADEIQKGDPSVTRPVAIAKALAANPDLYKG